MNDTLVVIDSIQDLRARPAYEASLAFHPHASRRFGSVIAPYRFLEKTICGIAHCHQPHMAGYLISTSDGKETGIGGNCGKTHFGVSFTRERKRVDQAIARRQRITAIRSMLETMSEMLVEIEALDMAYKDLSSLKTRLMGTVGTEVFQKLRLRADRDENVIEKEVPMTKAEAEAHFETSNRYEGDGLGWPTKPVYVTTLDGLSFFKARIKDMVVTNLIQPMRELSKVKPEELESLKPRQLQREAKWVGEVPKHLERAREVIHAGNRFFTPENLAKMINLGASSGPLMMMIDDLKAR
ncbi:MULTISPECIES: hypothetical protein [Pseudomonas]|uniref:hypothetical protein n=1 Tax=Pseudomonas TaxID=286 RepID=UPI000BE27329|nr:MULTISPECIES: hypothetical protein [Pseudomonas]QBR32921.1 hypothetical protein E3Z29_21565 [Pseudomonas sp. S150]UZT91105.1 hypothetical protein OPS05_18550 [Pseudomonas koreensis]